MSTAFPWLPGTATGIGSMPGTDPAEAARTVFGELPDLPHVPELPARGPGADMIGRTAALLTGLHVDLQPAGWRLVDRQGRDERRGRDHLSYDLDAVEEVAQSFRGTLKMQLAGPWTLAASLELPRGNRCLVDAGAVRDLVASLAETVALHLADMRRRVPGASFVLQLDEPSLPAVLGGRLRTASGFNTMRAVEEHDAEQVLGTVVASAGTAGAAVVVHCCAPGPPVALLRRAGALAVSADLALGVPDDALGELVDGGGSLWAGVVPPLGFDSLSTTASSTTAAPTGSRPDGGLSEAVATVTSMWRRLTLPDDLLPAAVVITPACGLAGASPGSARAVLAAARRAGRRLTGEADR